MIFDYFKGELTGEIWEEKCHSCYRMRYQNEHYEEIPVIYKGDAEYIEPSIEKYFGNDEPSEMVVTLPLVEIDQVVFEKQPKKQPEKNKKGKSL